jgi:hypothetical protein
VKRRLHREAGAVSGCSSRTYTYDVWMPHWLRMYRHMLDIHQAERLIVPGLQALPSRLSPRSLSHDRIRPPTRLSRVQSPSSSLPVFALSHMGLVSLCVCNRSPFIKQASRSVYGCCAPPTRSTSSVSISTWRHAALSQRFRPSLIAASHTHLTVRAASWATKFNLRHSGSSSDSDAHEEAAKAAVLEAIKGRQQTDLMLRCTVLDAEGTRNIIRSHSHHHNPSRVSCQSCVVSGLLQTAPRTDDDPPCVFFTHHRQHAPLFQTDANASMSEISPGHPVAFVLIIVAYVLGLPQGT